MNNIDTPQSSRVRSIVQGAAGLGVAAILSSVVLAATPAGAVHAVPEAPVVTTTALPSGTEGTTYSATLAATHPSSSVHWSLTMGNLPSGLHLSGSPGQITGIPRSIGIQSFTVSATGAGHLVGSAALSIEIDPPAAPALITTSLPTGTVATPYLAQLDASGGTAPYRWKITSGQLPSGLYLNRASGQIVGDPRSTGTSTFTVSITDHWGMTASTVLSITVVAASSPQFVTTSLPAGSVNTSYARQIQVTGGNGFYHFQIIDGQLPKGYALDAATGQIVGLSKLPTSETFTVLVSDGLGDGATEVLTLTVS